MHSEDRSTLRRRVLCFLVGLFNVAPRIALGQGSVRVRRIGVLVAGSPSADDAMTPLAELGWLEGRNLHVERRYANGRLDALLPLAEELVRANIEVMVTNGPNPTRAAMRATNTIPIVFMIASDPVGSGLVASLARPGGNVTGFSASSSEITAKLLSLLKEVLPSLRRISMLVVSGNPQFGRTRSDLERICQAAGIEALFMEVGAVGENDNAVAQMALQNVQALLLVPDAFIIEHRVRIINAALKRGLPTTGPDFASDGALVTYTSSRVEAGRRWANYVDRILRGAMPAALPVEQATLFELVINLKTARALGLTVSQSLLLQADDVIR